MAEVLRRHRVTMDDLREASGTSEGGSMLWVVVGCWSEQPDGIRCPEYIADLSSDWVYWHSESPEDAEDDSWFNLWVTEVSADSPDLVAILTAVASEQLWNVVLVPHSLDWLYHPYDGGADVICSTTSRRDALKERRSEWLSIHPSGL